MPKANELSTIDDRKAGLFLFFLAIVVYLPSMNGEFIWDDELYVQKNILLHTLTGLKQIWFDPQVNPQYYPLTFTTFWIEYQLWQLWPTGYHIVNVVLHASNALLLWCVLRRLAVPGAWVAAAIFALHPIQVESVAQISERKNVLSSFFYFASLLSYLRFSPPIIKRETSRQVWPYYVFSLAFFLCALLSKTATCSLPVVLLILLWWKSDVIRKADLLPVIPFMGFGLVFAFITTVVEKEVTGAIGGDWDFSFIERILIAGQALCFYLGKLLWPLNLIYIYPRWTIDTTIPSLYFYPLGVLVALIGAVYFQRRVGRAPLAALVFYIGTLFPVLGFVDFYLMRYTFVADHFQYLSSISIIALIGGGLWQFFVRVSASDNQMFISTTALAHVFFSLILLTLGILTWKQGHMYQSAETLWLDTLAKDPTSWVAHNNLGRVLLDRGSYQAALPHFESAVRLKPDLAEAEFNLALVLLKIGNYDGAIEHGLKTIRLQPGISRFYSIIGSALWNKGDLAQAEVYFRNAIRSPSPAPQAYYNLAVLYLQAPEDIKGPHQREAISYLEKALTLDPSSLQTMYALAWTLGTHPDSHIRDGRRALQLAEIACQITGYQNYTLLDTLAAAYAEIGQFSDAIRIAQIAADLSRAQSHTDSTHHITERIQQYQSRRPYHQSSIEPIVRDPLK